MAVSIRTAEASDFDASFELFELVAGEGLWIGAEPPLPRDFMQKRFERELRNEAAVTFLAEAGGVVIGRLNVEDQWGCAELGMLVHPEHRGQGIGAALLEACLGWCRDRGCHKVDLDVFPHNGPAIALYRKFGFAVEGRLVRRFRRPAVSCGTACTWGSCWTRTAPGSPHSDAPA